MNSTEMSQVFKMKFREMPMVTKSQNYTVKYKMLMRKPMAG